MKATNDLAQAPLYIDDSSDVGLLEIRAKARRLHQQRERPRADHRRLRPAHARRRPRRKPRRAGRPDVPGLKILARELDVPVIALSQLNRAWSSGAATRAAALRPARVRQPRTGRRPRHVHLPRRVLHEGGVRDPGEAELLIAKHRNGALGNVKLTFQAQYPRFMTYVAEDRFAMSGPCPYEMCDGSGFVVDAETKTARDCRCRPERIGRARARALSAVIPRRYRDVAFDRAAVVDMDPVIVRPVRRFADNVSDQLDAGEGLRFTGDVGTGKTTLAMLVSKAALEAGRSVAIYSLPRLLTESAPHLRRGLAAYPRRAARPSRRRRPAPSRRPRGGEHDGLGARGALLDHQLPLRAAARAHRHHQPRTRPPGRADRGPHGLAPERDVPRRSGLRARPPDRAVLRRLEFGGYVLDRDRRRPVG